MSHLGVGRKLKAGICQHLTMHRFACVVTAGRINPRGTPQANCELCRWGAHDQVARSLYDDAFLHDLAPLIINGRTAPRAVLCGNCLNSLAPVYSAARARIVDVLTDHRQHLSRLREIEPINVSVQVVAQRIAFLGGLHQAQAYHRPPPRGYVLHGDGDAVCPWCGAITLGTIDTLRITYRANHAQMKELVARIFPMHNRCWNEARQLIRDEYLTRCMNTLSFLLPTLPEIRRQIGAFVCRLAIIGLGAAAGNRCPVVLP